jgi:NAD(P)-dependent dehydrogenase (short-subunit alcohol dehydrogenase family)
MTTLNSANDLTNGASADSGSHKFLGQLAVVTGASSGIGKAIALELAAEGAKVCLVGRKKESLDAVAKSAQLSEQQMFGYQVDLTLDDEVIEFAKRVQREFGFVDLVVHGAGAIARGWFAEAPVEDLDWQYRVNVRAPYVLTQALLPMLKSRQGQIVFLNSRVVLLNAGVHSIQYTATKQALKSMADSLREEINPLGMRVLTVFLGRTATPMQALIHEIEKRPYIPEQLVQPGDVAKFVLAALNMPRTAEVTEIHIKPLNKSC